MTGHWTSIVGRMAQRSEDPETARCGRMMVGSGEDSWDPTCDLSPGHTGFCKSYDATDQHRLSKPVPDETETP